MTTSATSPPGDPLADLRAAACSDGAPSARNLIVTVFGDALLPHGLDTEITVGSLASLLAGFGVNERLVRTSLTRLANDGMLVSRTEGRRAFYRVAENAHELFRRADRRIYSGDHADWDGAWTLVVIDGTEATPARRAALRQELSWAGFGVVAPNVLASPTTEPDEVASAVARVGGLANVLVTRCTVIDGLGLLDSAALAQRSAPLDDLAIGYEEFVARFERFDAAAIAALQPDEAFKLRILLVAAFRRLVLADPSLPRELMPDGWVGARARRVAADLYRAVADDAERYLVASVEPVLDGPVDLSERHSAPA